MMPAKKKPLSGGARLIASGRSPMILGWTPEDRAIIEAAAHAEGRSLANFVQFHGRRTPRVRSDL